MLTSRWLGWLHAFTKSILMHSTNYQRPYPPFSLYYLSLRFILGNILTQYKCHWAYDIEPRVILRFWCFILCDGYYIYFMIHASHATSPVSSRYWSASLFHLGISLKGQRYYLIIIISLLFHALFQPLLLEVMLICYLVYYWLNITWRYILFLYFTRSWARPRYQ